MSLQILSDRSLIRAGARSTRYVKVSFTAPEAPRTGGRRPVTVALVLDRSGSMSGEKIRLARTAAQSALTLLEADDRFAVVVYDQEIDLLVESSPASPAARRRAAKALDATEARGSTDLCGGWLRGCEQVGLGLTDENIGRCLLLTDGLANHGITDRSQIIAHAAELRARGVATSTFGVGADFDERLLRGMAERSGGHFYYLQDARQIPDLLASEMGETLEVVARSATLSVELPAGGSVEPLGTFPARPAGRNTEIDLGDLVSGQEVEVTLAVTFGRGTEGETVDTAVSLTDRDESLEVRTQTLSWSYASHGENDRQPRERTVDRAVAEAYSARARDEATERNRHGDLDGARRVLRQTASRVGDYAGDDAELRALVGELLRESERFSERQFSPVMLKAEQFAAYAGQAARTPDGRARRTKGH